MFCKTKANWSQRALNGHGADSMGAVGYIFTEGARKQGEIRLKIGDQGIFCRCGNVPKKQVFGMDGQGCQRGQRARNFSKFRGAQGGYGYL